MCSADGRCLQGVILKLPSLAISNARDFFLLIWGIWQVWAPSLWERRWQLKGCWNDFTPTLVRTNQVSGESDKTLQICLNLTCVSDKCGRDLMLPVMVSAEVRESCLLTYTLLIDHYVQGSPPVQISVLCFLSLLPQGILWEGQSYSSCQGINSSSSSRRALQENSWDDRMVWKGP